MDEVVNEVKSVEELVKKNVVQSKIRNWVTGNGGQAQEREVSKLSYVRPMMKQSKLTWKPMRTTANPEEVKENPREVLGTKQVETKVSEVGSLGALSKVGEDPTGKVSNNVGHPSRVGGMTKGSEKLQTKLAGKTGKGNLPGGREIFSIEDREYIARKGNNLKFKTREEIKREGFEMEQYEIRRREYGRSKE